MAQAKNAVNPQPVLFGWLQQSKKNLTTAIEVGRRTVEILLVTGDDGIDDSMERHTMFLVADTSTR